METHRKSRLMPPRRRSLNDDYKDDFVAIDFETMSPERTSACAVGMVKVLDGEIVQEFYSLINPVRDERTDLELNILTHGISLSTAEKSPTFKDLFDGICRFVGSLPLVCHNKSVDMVIIDRLMEFYGLEGIDTSNSICTYKLTGKSLSKCCEEYGIKEERHHNALWDAEACAKIYLELIGKPYIAKGGNRFSKDIYKTRKVSKEHRVQLDKDQIENKDTIFNDSVVVITGIFDAFADRDDLAAKLQAYGARIVSSVTKKTTHVIVGNEPGPKKIEKIKTLQSEGVPIVILREQDIISILK